MIRMPDIHGGCFTRRSFPAVIATILAICCISSAPADIDWADSPAFGIDLLLSNGSVAYGVSSSFTLEAAPVARGWADSGTISISGNEELYVIFRNGTPIANAEVWAYHIQSYDQIVRVGDPVVTDSNGRAPTPGPFSDPYWDNVKLGLLAEITYTDPGSEETRTIVNYPNNDPFRPRTQRLCGTESIIVPYPVVLQGGLGGGLNSWTRMRRYLPSDPAYPPQEPGFEYIPKWSESDSRLPAYLVFTMPSNDEQSWGYLDGLPMSDNPYNTNIEKLDYFIRQKMRPELAGIVPNATQRNALPIYLCGKSMGGTITRGWMHTYRYSNPPVARYVSFDGVQGGTTFFYILGQYAPGFAEWYMNGENPIPYLAPLFPGWNCGRIVTFGYPESRLMLSSSTGHWQNPVVSPNCSALGVGRTMGLLWQRDVPNGHKKRFLSGWEKHLDGVGHTGITEDADVIFMATKFLFHGIAPDGATLAGSTSDCQEYPGLRTEELPARYSTTLATDGQPTAFEIMYLDENSFIEVSIFLEGAGASFDMLSGGSSLIPPDAEYLELAGARYLQFNVEEPPPGLVVLFLAAGTEDAQVGVGLKFANQRYMDLAAPEQPVFVGTPATIRASLKEGDGTVITGTAGAFAVEITLPDESVLVLTLFDDGNHDDEQAGDGIYGNVFFTPTDLGGRYLVDARGQLTHGDEITQRSDVGMFIVDSAPASFIGVEEAAVDDDQDGMIDAIEFECLVAVDEIGSYQIMASLYDADEEHIANAHVLFEVADVPAEQTETLRFEAGDIVMHGAPGPYTLREIQLLDNDQVLVADVWPDHTTAAYDLASFAPPPEPVLYRATPNTGGTQGGNTITLDGEHFLHVIGILIGDQEATEFEVVNETVIRVVVPPSPGQQHGYVDITLITPWHETVMPAAYRYKAEVINSQEVRPGPTGSRQPVEAIPQ